MVKKLDLKISVLNWTLVEKIRLKDLFLDYKLIDLKIAHINFELMKSDSIQSIVGTPKW